MEGWRVEFDKNSAINVLATNEKPIPFIMWWTLGLSIRILSCIITSSPRLLPSSPSQSPNPHPSPPPPPPPPSPTNPSMFPSDLVSTMCIHHFHSIMVTAMPSTCTSIHIDSPAQLVHGFAPLPSLH
ncbi:hypothetical protein EGR_08125 [Echinococcus granulosus]|uniref:Uncharacterized protein n=1 Tax=Echinococcus granulosus TaxID=6210 RepID=W6UUI1_ECHGR|nr:hypothetical protein EGR_08125 [Echinococcus granulosus]EUB57049.1 hypothetical protein EGR_08125 [Echinococcus granulosus]